MEEFLNELLTFVDKQTDWKENNDTTNSQVIGAFLANNDALVKKFVNEMCEGDTQPNTGSGLHLADVMAMLPVNEEIQVHIVEKTRNEHGERMMDEQTFYEGAKWLRERFIEKINGN